LLPQAEESEMYLADYGQQMAERKKELIDDSGTSHHATSHSRSKKSAKHADPRE
jgi:hypothetical protein